MVRFDYRQAASTAAAPGGGWRALVARQPQLPYLLPFFAYLLLMLPETFPTVGGVNFHDVWHTWHPLIYASESAAAGVLLWFFWPCYAHIRWTHLGVGALVGLIGTPVWILVHYGCLRSGWWHMTPLAELYNPDVMFGAGGGMGGPWQRWAYLCVRVAGPALVVPVMEELFFRDFLMRTLISGAHFEEVAVGSFTWMSFLGMAALFGMNHGSMWPGGVVYGLMMGLLLVRTKSLGACIVAHGMTNLTLYLYVIYSGDWQFM